MWEKKAQEAARANATKSFIEWQMEQAKAENHHKGIYGWIKKGAGPQDPQDEAADKTGKIQHGPLAAAEARVVKWKKFWRAGDEEIKETLVEINRLRIAAKKEQIKDAEAENVREALYTFKDGTGQGPDRTGPLFYKRQPPGAEEKMVKWLNRAKNEVAWPWQILLSTIAMLGKPVTGEDRPIGLTCFPTRLFFRIHRNQGRKWATDKRGEWDQAVAGSSALSAAVLQALGVESAILNEEFFVQLALDAEKFYDSIRLKHVAAQCLQRGFSPTIMAMNLMLCLGPRTIRVREAYSRPLATTASIVAGLGEANNLARLMVYAVMEDMACRFRHTPTMQFVDDFSLHVRGKNENAVALVGARAQARLIDGLLGLDLKISKKSTVQTNSELAAKMLTATAAARGVSIQRVEATKVLGVDISGGKRAQKTLNARNAKAQKVGKKVRQLRFEKTRRRMTTTAVQPRIAYGRCSAGTAPTVAKRLRGNQATLHGWKHGMCATTLLALRKNNIEVELVWLQLQCWIEVWAKNGPKRQQWRQDWETARGKLLELAPESRWKEAKGIGPIQATILTLWDQGWEEEGPDKWKDPEGNEWQMPEGPVDQEVFKKVVEKFAWKLQWAQAAGHRNGAGLEEGFCEEQALSHIKRLKKANKDKEAGLLEKILTAGLWPAQRLKEQGYEVSGACVLCGQEEQDEEFHRAWRCPVVLKADHPDIASTNRWRQMAEAERECAPCFWTRGLLQEKWLHLTDCAPEGAGVVWTIGKPGKNLAGESAEEERQPPGEQQPKEDAAKNAREEGQPPPEEQQPREEEPDEIINVEGRTLYLDESGGKFSGETRLRKCGWGVADVDPETDDFVGGWFAGLGGQDQTHFRAALEATLFVLKKIEGNAVLAPDSINLVEGLAPQKLAENMAKGNLRHADLWEAIEEASKRRQGQLTIKKVKAHREIEEVAKTGREVSEWIGNTFADALAGKGAELAQRPACQAKWLSILKARATMVQKRLLAVNSLALEKIEEEKKQPQVAPRNPKASLHRALAESGHKLGWNSEASSAFCSRCCQKVPKQGLRKWLASNRCEELVATSGGEAWRRQSEQSTAGTRGPCIGRMRLHPSHALCFYRGVWLCTGCGCYAVADEGAAETQKAAAKHLARFCQKKKGQDATRGGREVLRRISQDKPPKKSMKWPRLPASGEGPPIPEQKGSSRRRKMAPQR